MHRYSYLYENIMFTNKWDAALFWERKALNELEEFALIKSLIYARKKERA